jgi:multidrug efflux system outer membrane protein
VTTRPLLAVLLAAGVLSGCTLIPHYTRPALPVAASYPSGPAYGPHAPAPVQSAANIGWKDFFADPVMQSLIELALQNNRDLSIAADNVLSAQATFRVRRASLFPTIDASASGDFEHLPAAAAGGFVENINAYSLSLGAASYELDVFGRLRSLAEQARQQYLSQAETRQSTEIALIAQIASSYLSLLADREALAVSRKTADAQQHSYDLRVLTLNQGSGTALDVAQAESALRTAQARLAQYTRQEAQDFDEIVLLAGTSLPPALQARMTAERDLNAQPAFPDLPEGLPADLLLQRPDIRAAEHTLRASNANIGAARAAFFPSVVLTGSGGTTSGTVGSLFGAGTGSWLFQPQISVPIFDAGANFANLDIAKLQKRVDIATYEKTIQSAFHDVSNALAARATYDSELEAEKKLVDADKRFYELSKMRFDAGVDSYLSVIVAENSYFGAQLNLVTLRLAQRANLVSLYEALGGGWTTYGKK